MEIELKYKATKEEAMQILPKDFTTIEMTATYFDTAKHTLRDRKISIRFRKENDDNVVTCKWGGVSTKGLHKRGEYNINVDADWLDNPKPEVLADCEAYDDVVEALGGEYSNEWGNLVPREKLHPVVATRFTRYEALVHLREEGDATGILSYDEGLIITKDDQEEISEIEVELENGTELDLKYYGHQLENKYGLVPFDKSKYARGIAMINRKKAKEV